MEKRFDIMTIAKKIYAATFLLFLFFAANVSAQQNAKPLMLSTKEKREIIKRVFDDGFEKLLANERFSECKIPKVKGKKIILVKTKESNLFPKGIKSYRFRFLSEKGIETEVTKNSGACFFEVEDFKITDSNTVEIIMWRWIQNSVTSTRGSLGAEGLIYKAVKTNGKWVVQFSEATSVWS